MDEMNTEEAPRVDVFLMGVSKAASTWIYRCLKEHPEVFVPDSDSLAFYDLKYHHGMESYARHFSGNVEGKIAVDASPTYFRSPVAASRIAQHHPQAKIVISLRNPVERAFSQYWHEKRQGKMEYDFNDCIHHFMLFPWIVEHGFYATHLERLLDKIPRENVSVVLFDELQSNPREFLEKVLTGMGLSTDFSPSVMNRRINEAKEQYTGGMKVMRSMRDNPVIKPVRKFVRKFIKGRSILTTVGAISSNKKEYEEGMTTEQRQELLKIYKPEIERLEILTGLDLSPWK